MSELKVTAKVEQVHATETKGNYSFTNLWATVDHESQYPQFCEFQANGMKSDIFNVLKVGDIVDLHINLRGRKWDGNGSGPRVFNTLSVWKVERVGQATAAPVTHTSGNYNPNDYPASGGAVGDLPF